MEPWQWMLAVLAGAAGQLLDSVAGMGFGALSGAVVLAAGMAPATVVAAVSTAKMGSGLISAAAHWKASNVHPRWVFQIAVPGIVGGTISASILTVLPADALRLLLPLLLFSLGLALLRRFLPGAQSLPPIAGGSEAADLPLGAAASRAAAPPALWLPAIGLAAGLTHGLTGAFGPIATTALVLRSRSHPRHAIGSVNAAEFFVSIAVSATLLIRLDPGIVPLSFPLALVAGSLLTAPIGVRIVTRLPARVVGLAIAATLLTVSAAAAARAFA